MFIQIKDHLQTKVAKTLKMWQYEHLPTNIFGLNGNICVTSGFGSFDNCALISVSTKLLAASALFESGTVCDC